jgi:hypothetical protein
MPELFGLLVIIVDLRLACQLRRTLSPLEQKFQVFEASHEQLTPIVDNYEH